ncbi:hypothetical protein DERF_012329 [Dermatophagoides farinae]|uniref:Uncharacterized protein n=1 Tax=Dermatophagoides farinae TaxID=6954 RepID=A0A922KX67_DERFA|nr:hypothetical protein DERF_012329 [Dermatophagoides farinae]
MAEHPIHIELIKCNKHYLTLNLGKHNSSLKIIFNESKKRLDLLFSRFCILNSELVVLSLTCHFLDCELVVLGRICLFLDCEF